MTVVLFPHGDREQLPTCEHEACPTFSCDQSTARCKDKKGVCNIMFGMKEGS